ncbi:MAG: Gfo/Idh/MocA family oxidoreductase [Kiritimatiellae bacterium]|nr:Gfo/Idh/MocA family oxidoreductase [Kiritimatiellia bacterium]
MAAIRVGIIGMGGFAGSHHGAVMGLEERGECRLVCTCDPAMARFAERRAKLAFERRGVRVFDDYVTMLDTCRDELDMVAIPTPVPLHAPMHRAAVERGLAVYLEKPPTLHIGELEAMLEIERQAARLTQVGFNFIIEQARQALKRRILDGEFGKVLTVSFCGLIPRTSAYFGRSNWAARLMMDGRLVLDSCIGNAMAHNLHNILFWCGQDGVLSWGRATGLRAECYRAHDVEGLDTVFFEAETEQKIRIRVAASHACDRDIARYETIECEKATLTVATRGDWEVAFRDGRREAGETDGDALLSRNHEAYYRYLRGEADRPITRLADSRAFVECYDLIYVAAGAIASIPDAFIARSPDAKGGGGEFAAARDLDKVAETFVATGRLPSEQGVPWAVPGGSAGVGDLGRLTEVVEAMMGG